MLGSGEAAVSKPVPVELPVQGGGDGSPGTQATMRQYEGYCEGGHRDRWWGSGCGNLLKTDF